MRYPLFLPPPGHRGELLPGSRHGGPGLLPWPLGPPDLPARSHLCRCGCTGRHPLAHSAGPQVRTQCLQPGIPAEEAWPLSSGLWARGWWGPFRGCYNSGEWERVRLKLGKRDRESTIYKHSLHVSGNIRSSHPLTVRHTSFSPSLSWKKK